MGNEGEARELRYEAIKKKQKGIVALGHHQNDQAETLMLQLLRGSGLRGLAGMQEFDEKRKFWRPMLNIKKELIKKYASENNIEYIEDESNEDVNFDRNLNFASASNNIKIIDSINENITKGNYAEIFKNKDSMFITKRAIIASKQNNDSLYIHSDTILITGNEQNRVIRAFKNAKIFRIHY